MALKITPVDETKVEEGVWTDYMGVELLVARSTNVKYVNDLARRTKFINNAVQRSTMSADDMTKALCESASRYLLLDWKKFPGGTKYSQQNAYDLLMNDSDARQFVLDFSADIANFMEEEVEEVVGK